MITQQEALKSATHQHYKGGLYKWIAEAKHSETGETMVLYEHVWPHAQTLYVRPAEMFYGGVEVQGDIRPRFAPIAGSPSGSSMDPSQALAVAIDTLKQCGADTMPEVSALISACALVSLHHKLSVDRIMQLEKQMKLLCPECKGGGRVNAKAGATVILVECPQCKGYGMLKGAGIH